jgi:hypothetical protein
MATFTLNVITDRWGWAMVSLAAVIVSAWTLRRLISLRRKKV